MAIINNSICEYCVSSCQTCQSSNNSACTSCYSLTYLYMSTCLANCPDGTYRDNTINKCLPCISPCLYCSSANSCLSCIAALNLFLENGTCIGCINSCSTCIGSRTSCNSCSLTTGYPFLLNNNCLVTCPLKYYNDNSLNLCTNCT